MHAARHAGAWSPPTSRERALELAALQRRAQRHRRTSSSAWAACSSRSPGRRFDHIVSNPPFVITPRVEGVPDIRVPRRRHGRRRPRRGGDADGGREHLTPGGVAQTARQLGVPDGGSGRRDAACARGSTAREVTPHRRSTTGSSSARCRARAEYAETWIRDGGTRPGTAGLRPALRRVARRLRRARRAGRVRLRRASTPGRGARRSAGSSGMHGPLGENEAASACTSVPRSPRTTGRRALDRRRARRGTRFASPGT